MSPTTKNLPKHLCVTLLRHRSISLCYALILCVFEKHAGDATHLSQDCLYAPIQLCYFLKILSHIMCVCAFIIPFRHHSVLCSTRQHVFIMFFVLFLFNSALSWSFFSFFFSITLILLGPLTAQPNYNKFLIFRSVFARTLSFPFTSLRAPSISLCASFSADQNYRPSWIRSCFCHCDGNAWYRLIM